MAKLSERPGPGPDLQSSTKASPRLHTRMNILTIRAVMFKTCYMKEREWTWYNVCLLQNNASLRDFPPSPVTMETQPSTDCNSRFLRSRIFICHQIGYTGDNSWGKCNRPHKDCEISEHPCLLCIGGWAPWEPKVPPQYCPRPSPALLPGFLSLLYGLLLQLSSKSSPKHAY